MNRKTLPPLNGGSPLDALRRMKDQEFDSTRRNVDALREAYLKASQERQLKNQQAALEVMYKQLQQARGMAPAAAAAPAKAAPRAAAAAAPAPTPAAASAAAIAFALELKGVAPTAPQGSASSRTARARIGFHVHSSRKASQIIDPAVLASTKAHAPR